MSLIKINWYPNRKQLRVFGIIALIASTLICLLLFFVKGLAIQYAVTVFAAGFIIFLTSEVCAKLTRAIYLGLTLAALPIGLVVSFILMATFYFLLLTPLGLLFRLIGRDALCRKFDPGAKSYWLTHQLHNEPERYFRQF